MAALPVLLVMGVSGSGKWVPEGRGAGGDREGAEAKPGSAACAGGDRRPRGIPLRFAVN